MTDAELDVTLAAMQAHDLGRRAERALDRLDLSDGHRRLSSRAYSVSPDQPAFVAGLEDLTATRVLTADGQPLTSWDKKVKATVAELMAEASRLMMRGESKEAGQLMSQARVVEASHGRPATRITPYRNR